MDVQCSNVRDGDVRLGVWSGPLRVCFQFVRMGATLGLHWAVVSLTLALLSF